MKYLKLFEKQTDYQSFVESDSFVTPNVSYAKEENLLHFNAAPEAPQYDFFIYILSDVPLSDSDSFEEAWQEYITMNPDPYETSAQEIKVYDADSVDMWNGVEIYNPSQPLKNEGNVYVKLSNAEVGSVSGLLPYSMIQRDFSDGEDLHYSFYECSVDKGNMILYTETDNINWRVGNCEPW